MRRADTAASSAFNFLTAASATNTILTVGGSGTVTLRTIDAANAAATVAFERSRFSGGVQTAVQDGDVLQQLSFAGYGGGASAAVTAATITARVQQASPSSTQMGGKLVLATTAAGGTTPTNTWTLDNAGRTLHGQLTTDPTASSITSACECARGCACACRRRARAPQPCSTSSVRRA